MNNKRIMSIVLTILVLAMANTSFATLRRVNNNTGVTGAAGTFYATLSAAYTAAVAGDTLLIEGSNTSYGDLTLTKKLTIFGPGYQLTQNPQTQASLLTVTLGDITYGAGSSGSLISGCKINSVTVNSNDITISRNYIKNATASSPSINLNDVTNVIIQQNIIYGLITNIAGKKPTVVIRNNYLGRIVFTESIQSALISSNTFQHEPSSNGGYQTYCCDVYNSTIIDNIFYATYYWNYGAVWYGMLKFEATQNNTISYNILSQADPGLGVGSNNQFNVDMTAVFVTGTGDIDKNYKVKAGSVAETGSQTGGECGMFGGTHPYVLSGLPPIPHIYMIDADPAGTTSLKVKISVKSQN